MAQPINTPAIEVRTRLAQTILGPITPPPQLGAITLFPYQTDALHRIKSTLTTAQGALLCDDVGLGKTYIALAIAKEYKHPLIIAPASLRTMWKSALETTNSHARWCSTERLSHKGTPKTQHDIIIVDEAHHFRNAHTARYRALTQLCATARVLLLTATPIHNKPKDLTTLAALFLGERAHTLSSTALAQLITHRTTKTLNSDQPATPTIRLTHWLKLPHNPSTLNRILALPPPIPIHHTHEPAQLVTISLLRQWLSSDAALRHTLERRITRAAALIATLESGHLPTPNDLRRWLNPINALQLEFPELIPRAAISDTHLTETIRAHQHALRSLLHDLPPISPFDIDRAHIIQQIHQHHPNQRIVAFSHSADTVRSLFHTLKHNEHIAALTGHTGHIVSGHIPRHELIETFIAQHQPHHLPIKLLLTTDILREGVNLQIASVVIHLDLPWTPAAFHQRNGRLARIGSPHREITVYAFRPAKIPDEWLRLSHHLRTKYQLTNALWHNADESSNIHRILSAWRTSSTSLDLPLHCDVPCATVFAGLPKQRPTILAACLAGGTAQLVTAELKTPIRTDDASIRQSLNAVTLDEAPHDTTLYTLAIQKINEWWHTQSIDNDIGLNTTSPHLTPLPQKSRTATRRLIANTLALPPTQRQHAAALASSTLHGLTQATSLHNESQHLATAHTIAHAPSQRLHAPTEADAPSPASLKITALIILQPLHLNSPRH